MEKSSCWTGLRNMLWPYVAVKSPAVQLRWGKLSQKRRGCGAQKWGLYRRISPVLRHSTFAIFLHGPRSGRVPFVGLMTTTSLLVSTKDGRVGSYSWNHMAIWDEGLFMKMATKQNLMHAIYPRKCNADAEGRYVFSNAGNWDEHRNGAHGRNNDGTYFAALPIKEAIPGTVYAVQLASTWQHIVPLLVLLTR